MSKNYKDVIMMCESIFQMVFININFVELLLKQGYFQEELFENLMEQRVKWLSEWSGHSYCNLSLMLLSVLGDLNYIA